MTVKIGDIFKFKDEHEDATRLVVGLTSSEVTIFYLCDLSILTFNISFLDCNIKVENSIQLRLMDILYGIPCRSEELLC